MLAIRLASASKSSTFPAFVKSPILSMFFIAPFTEPSVTSLPTLVTALPLENALAPKVI